MVAGQVSGSPSRPLFIAKRSIRIGKATFNDAAIYRGLPSIFGPEAEWQLLGADRRGYHSCSGARSVATLIGRSLTLDCYLEAVIGLQSTGDD